MKVKDVIFKYHGMVEFPWTLAKLKKAGYTPESLILAIGEELAGCDDVDTPTGKAVLDSIEALKG